jgi:hypothetical protein
MLFENLGIDRAIDVGKLEDGTAGVPELEETQRFRKQPD